jgi:type VI secretion system protein ImpF
MPRTDNEVRVTPSVLDRLLDYEVGKSRESAGSRSRNLRELKECVRRDIEWLLNTRQSNIFLPADLKETNSSIAGYGLPDFSSTSIRNPAELIRVRQAIETAVDRFEPRLQDVRITIDAIPEGERVIHFRIDARLRVEPSPEPVVFDSVMRLGSGECVVKEE